MWRLRSVLYIGALLVVLGLRSIGVPGSLADSQTAARSGVSSPTQESETNLVLVDAIATEGKDHYVQDLDKTEFHVYEDGAEQQIRSFFHESDRANAMTGRRHMVILFDDSAMNTTLRIYARQQASNLLQSTAPYNPLVAVAAFADQLKILQDFTADCELLMRSVTGPKAGRSGTTWGGENSGVWFGRGAQQPTTFGPPLPGLLPALRSIAKSLNATPGRKILILFSPGFLLTGERPAELTTAIDALNKANIPVYSVDVRGVGSLSANTSTPPAVRAMLNIRGDQASLGTTLAHRLEFPVAFAAFPAIGQQQSGPGIIAGSGGGVKEVGETLGVIPRRQEEWASTGLIPLACTGALSGSIARIPRAERGLRTAAADRFSRPFPHPLRGIKRFCSIWPLVPAGLESWRRTVLLEI